MNEQLENTPNVDGGVTTSAPSTETNASPDNTSLVSFAIKALAIIGLVALLSGGVWAGTKVVQLAPHTFLAAVQSLTSIFVPAGERENIEFTIDTHNLESEKEFILSWKHTTKHHGNYFFSYTCEEDVSVEAETIEGKYVAVPCGASFAILQDTNILPLTFISTRNRFVDVSVFISFIPNGTENASVQGSTTLTVTNTKLSGTSLVKTDHPDTEVKNPVQPLPGTPKNEVSAISGNTGGVSPVRISDPQGTPDLVVAIIATGFVDKTTNAFTPGPVGENDRAAVRFQVENNGTKVSGEWSFIVDLPLSTGTYVYRPTETQTTLYPGERVEYTLGFDSINRSTATAHVVINIDTEHVVSELNRSNNVAESFVLFK